jgi:hypothetical protein
MDLDLAGTISDSRDVAEFRVGESMHGRRGSLQRELVREKLDDG